MQAVLPEVVFAGGTSYFGRMLTKKTPQKADEGSGGNYAIHYFMGLKYLREGNREAAIEEWKRYVKMAPRDSKSLAVRERLTLLKLAQAKDFAKRAVKQGTKNSKTNVIGNTVAVFDFEGPTTPQFKALSKGLTSMIITDLSKIPQFQIVEREKMQALVREIRLGQSGIVDEKTAPRFGKMMFAKKTVWGKLDPNDETRLRISSIITENLGPKELGDVKTEGPVEEFFKLEKEIVFEIAETLGIKKESLDDTILKAMKKIHSRNFEAIMSYSIGLDYFDQGMFGHAREAFTKAVELDPNFELAEEARISTPTDADSEKGNKLLRNLAANEPIEIERKENLYDVAPEASPSQVNRGDQGPIGNQRAVIGQPSLVINRRINQPMGVIGGPVTNSDQQSPPAGNSNNQSLMNIN
jgi:tetratricopeptide (TPR) repeat protein